MKITNASVKVMRSYDYCHFEIALSADEGVPFHINVDDLRKEAMRLADKAVEQYKIAKRSAINKTSAVEQLSYLQKQMKVICENYPKSEWTEEQKAIVKTVEDYEFQASRHYDYEDDWEEEN